MEIRQFKQEDEAAVIELWNKCCTKDTIDLKRFRNQALYDDNFDESLVWCAFDQNRLAGFIMATKRKFPYMERGLEESKGWINVLFVDPKHRRNKIGSALLKLAEQELIRRDVKQITLGAYSPNYFFPGIDEQNYDEAAQFFQYHHYQRGNLHYSMGMDLSMYMTPEQVLRKRKELERTGYQFIQFNGKYSLDCLQFLKEEFGGGWKRNALNLMRLDLADKVIVIVLNPIQKICGVCMRAIDGNPERFGPIGIAESERNAKIGTALLHSQLENMKNQGCSRMYFMTTDENGKRFYERNGLYLIRTYREYQKEI